MGVISSRGDMPGKPAIDADICTACGECARVCPVEVLSKRDGSIRIDSAAGFGCIACGQCMMVCPLDCISVTGRGLSPGDLVPLPTKADRATPEQLEALLLSRRSTRRFKEDEVPRELIDRIIAAASMAPMGIPPWEVGVTVFHGREKVAELARDTSRTYARMLKVIDNPFGRGMFRLFAKKTTRQQFESFILPLGRIIAEGGKTGKDYVLYDAPAALLFHASPYADVADAAIACTYAMISAQSLGLGSCMIGCLAPAIARRKDLLKKYGLPEGHLPKIVLIVGYPAMKFRKGIRRQFQSLNYF